jgi:hypothetical protein
VCRISKTKSCNHLVLRTNVSQIFCLSFGPKSFVVISDPAYAKQILVTNAANYSKGLLSEILVSMLSIAYMHD